mgnify:CR=1
MLDESFIIIYYNQTRRDRDLGETKIKIETTIAKMGALAVDSNEVFFDNY